MIDFDALVFGPVHDTFGQQATLRIGLSTFDIAVIDQTRGVTIDEAGSIGVQTIQPAVDVRRSALARLALHANDLPDARIGFNGTAWSIKSVVEHGHEYRLILIELLEQPAFLLTEPGDFRITEAGAFRILE
jgi:hypothetical protein